MENKGFLMKILPWLLIILGFFTLNMFQGFIALPCMVIGISMLIERRWPEKWDNVNNNSNTIAR
jgi:hypothetical protein